MKASFEILKNKPKLLIDLTRDSVCAGDDCDAPHEKKVEVYSFLDPVTFASEVSSGYLPSVAGVGHTWTCTLNGQKIAKIKFESIEALVKEILFDAENRVHFTYHAALS